MSVAPQQQTADTPPRNEVDTNVGDETEGSATGLTDEERFRIAQIPDPGNSEGWLSGKRFEGELLTDECYAVRHLDWSEERLCEHFGVDRVALRYHRDGACGCLHYDGHDVTLAECCELRQMARDDTSGTADMQYRYSDVTIEFHVSGSCTHRTDIEPPLSERNR